MKTDTNNTAGSDCQERLVRLVDMISIVSKHPEYPEPCPMLHEIAAKAAAEMDKEWVMHMVRETCRQTKEAILADLTADGGSDAPNCSPWAVYSVNDYDWWIARSSQEAFESYMEAICDNSCEINVRQLSDADLDMELFFDEGHNPSDPAQWFDDEGNGDDACRWNGRDWERHKGYPIGHVRMNCATKRSFREELNRRVAEGITKPTMFATTEF